MPLKVLIEGNNNNPKKYITNIGESFKGIEFVLLKLNEFIYILHPKTN